MRGDVYELPTPRGSVGHEQRGARYAVVVQSDDLPLSTVIVVPTSTRAAEAPFRPVVRVRRQSTRALAEQVTTIDPQRLGRRVGTLSPNEMTEVTDALRRVLAADIPW